MASMLTARYTAAEQRFCGVTSIGLVTGDAGRTAGNLLARRMINSAGTNCRAGQYDRSLLARCCRRELEVAYKLGALLFAFPLISSAGYD